MSLVTSFRSKDIPIIILFLAYYNMLFCRYRQESGCFMYDICGLCRKTEWLVFVVRIGEILKIF